MYRQNPNTAARFKNCWKNGSTVFGNGIYFELRYILEKLFSENDLLFGFRKKLTVTKGSIGGSDCTNYNPSLTYPSNIPSLTHPLKQKSKTVHYITLIT